MSRPHLKLVSWKDATRDGKRLHDEGREQEPLGLRTRWWNITEEHEVANNIAGLVEFWRHQQHARMLQLNIAARIYGNLSPAGTTGLSLSRIGAIMPTYRSAITFNAIQSALDAITAKIAKSRPKPLFLPNGENYKIQRRAKKMNRIVEGVFHANRAYDLGPIIFRDAGVWGDGIVKVYGRNERVIYERIRTDELFLDEWEALNGNPRQIHQVRMVSREVLEDLFPDKIAEIREASSIPQTDEPIRPHASDMLSVCESWHLAGPDGSAGHHCICINGHMLTTMEPWPHDFFPFARMRWSPRLYGYWSQSGIEQTQQLQIELNRSLQTIAQTLYRGSTYRVFVEMGSKVVKEHLNNDIGSIVMYNGTPPQYAAPLLVQPEFFQHVRDTIERIYHQFGVSMLSAVSEKPAGINSGKALREMNDIESDRFTTLGQQYEQFFLDLARLTIATVSDMAKSGTKFQVYAPGTHVGKLEEWKDASLDNDEYTIHLYPVSSLPDDPAGRLADIQDLAQAGIISQRQARRLLDFPDLRHVEDLDSAAEEYMEFVVEKIVDDGEYTVPTAFNDLAYGRKLALDTYNMGLKNGLEQERLTLLRRFVDQIDGMLDQQAQQLAAQQQTAALQGAVTAQGGPAMAPPIPPQPSGLVPNVPASQ